MRLQATCSKNADGHIKAEICVIDKGMYITNTIFLNKHTNPTHPNFKLVEGCHATIFCIFNDAWDAVRWIRASIEVINNLYEEWCEIEIPKALHIQLPMTAVGGLLLSDYYNDRGSLRDVYELVNPEEQPDQNNTGGIHEQKQEDEPEFCTDD